VDCRNNEPLAGANVILKNFGGDSVQTTTAEDGSYEFRIPGNITNQELVVRKDLYKEMTGPVSISATDESGWLTDIMLSTPLCLEKKLVIKVENIVTVYFDFDKSDLQERGLAQLDSIYVVLNENPAATLQISGYTDGLGSVEYNIKLSDRRAKACADYLIGKGIDSTRITFESFGACCPIEMELLNGLDNPDGRSKNRRALINISKE
jgi:outer membrane protein OmpA-like peptidoglycan-associated protein